MTLSQKDRFLSNELFDCPVCGQPIVQIESQLKNHIGCLSGHYDRYDLIPHKVQAKSMIYLYLAEVGKYTMGVVPPKHIYRKELVTTVDGYFIRTTHGDADIYSPTDSRRLTFVEVFDANFSFIWCSETFVNLAFDNVSDWLANNRIME